MVIPIFSKEMLDAIREIVREEIKKVSPKEVVNVKTAIIPAVPVNTPKKQSICKRLFK